jgi:hypothetical protein
MPHYVGDDVEIVDSADKRVWVGGRICRVRSFDPGKSRRQLRSSQRYDARWNLRFKMRFGAKRRVLSAANNDMIASRQPLCLLRQSRVVAS